MSEQQVDVEVQARELGWTPKEEFRGDPEKWTDASTFVERGQHVLPILKKNNEKLMGTVLQLRGEVQRVEELFKASQEAITALKETQDANTKRQVERARADLVAELKAAKKEGDTDSEVDLQLAINKLDSGLAAAKAGEKVDDKPVERQEPTRQAPQEDPAFTAWKSENAWFESDEVMGAAAVAIGQRLIRENSGLKGKAFYDAVGAATKKRFGIGQPPPGDRVEGARGSGGRGGGGGGKSYNDLPSDAKEVCEKDAKRLVGPGRAFKDIKEWRSEYVRIYFKDN